MMNEFNLDKYSKEINDRANIDTNADDFCEYYFAEGYNDCVAGELLVVLRGPRLKRVLDRDGNKIIYPELAGMSARVQDGKITKLYYE